jgi:hypothetical protein
MSVVDDAQSLVSRFGIHFKHAESVPIFPSISIPAFFRVPSLLVVRPFVPCLFLWDKGDFVNGAITLALQFDHDEELVRVEKRDNSFGLILVELASKHALQELTSVTIENTDGLSSDASILFAVRDFEKDEAVETLRDEAKRIKYFNAARDTLAREAPALTPIDDDVLMMTKTYKPLVDAVTLQHFADSKNVIVYTCCGTLFTTEFVFESHAVYSLRKLRYPCQCPECGTLAFSPTGNIRRLQKVVLNTMRDKTMYTVHNGTLEFI